MANPELVAIWHRYAEMDYNIAIHDLTFHPIPIEIICYHVPRLTQSGFYEFCQERHQLLFAGDDVPQLVDAGILAGETQRAVKRGV